MCIADGGQFHLTVRNRRFLGGSKARISVNHTSWRSVSDGLNLRCFETNASINPGGRRIWCSGLGVTNGKRVGTAQRIGLQHGLSLWSTDTTTTTAPVRGVRSLAVGVDCTSLVVYTIVVHIAVGSDAATARGCALVNCL